MADEPNDLQTKLDQLKKEFTLNLPSKIDQIRDQWYPLRDGNWDLDQLSELLNLVHKIAGSGGVFGFSRVSEVGCKIESFLQKAIRLKKPMKKKGLDTMEGYLKELYEAANSCNE